jgi:sulfoxide reductase heme-binding subunit YedZ
VTGKFLLALSSALLVAMCAGILHSQGWNEEGFRAVIRATARTSLAFFLIAYVASPIRAFIRNGATKWLLAKRRYTGLAYAVSHTLHLMAIVALARGDSDFELSPIAIAFGGTGYAFLYAMAFTSTDRAVAALGIGRWRTLHRTGMHYNWFIFLQSYIGRALSGEILYVGLAILISAAAMVRAAAFARARRSREGRAQAS